MNSRQTRIAIQILIDPRLPLELSDLVFGDVPAPPLSITDERLQLLARYVPDLVMEFRQAAHLQA